MTSQRAPRPRAWVIHLALLACLLLTQSLGFVHRSVHQEAGHADVTGDSAPVGTSGVADLFAGHDLDADCRLFDQLAHADLASLPVSALPCDFTAAQAAELPPCGYQPAPERSYCARGPPASA